MEWWQLLLVFISGLVALLLMGLPIAFSFILVNMIGVYFIMGGSIGMNQLVLSMYDSIAKFSLAPVPLFVFMGEIIFNAKIAKRVLNVLNEMLGIIPGRLSVLAGGAGILFGALSGSNMANTALLGSILVPEMEQHGYHKSMIVGPILASGGLAMIIPPSSLMVVYASVAQLSVAKLLIAGILPGVIMGTFHITYIILRCKFNPSLAPLYKTEGNDFSTRIKELVKIIVPVAVLIFGVVGTIFAGIATPTEAAAVGALFAMILAIFYKEFSWNLITKSLRETVKMTAMLFLIICGSSAFSQILSFSGATRAMITFVTQLDLSQQAFVLVVMVLVIIMGCFLEQISIMMIAIPIFMPLVHALGIDPIWFSILFMISLEIGLITPPFGLNLFVMKSVAPNYSTADIYRAAGPFVVCDLASLTLLFSIPILVTWLPSML